MAIIDQDENNLKEILGATHIDARFKRFLWVFLATKSIVFEADQHGPHDTNYIINFLHQNKNLIYEFKKLSTITPIPAEHMDWIDNSPEQKKYILERLPVAAQNATAPEPIYSQTPGLINKIIDISSKIPYLEIHLKPRDLAIAIIDNYTIKNTEKIAAINKIKAGWIDLSRKDSIYKWFGNDPKKIQHAWQWLIKLEPLLTADSIPFTKSSDLKTFFKTKMINHSDREIAIRKIRDSWGQAQYRQKNTEKSQANFMISIEAIRSLEQLAKKNDISKAKMIERLINNEFKRQFNATDKLH